MLRRILRVFGLTVAAICLLLAAFPLWSLRNPEAVYYVGHKTRLLPDTDTDVMLCLHGRSVDLLINRFRGPPYETEPSPGFYARFDDGKHKWPQIGFSGGLDFLYLAPEWMYAGVVGHQDWHGFGCVRIENSTSDPGAQWVWSVKAPIWLVAPLLSVPTLFYLAGCLQRRFRRRAGVCRNCGYDLRATPDRCPECATVPIKPA